MRWSLLGGLALCLAVPCTSAQEERFEFKGVKLGGTRDEFKAQLPLWLCRDSDDRVLADYSCYGAAKYNCRGKSNEECMANFGYAGTQPTMLSANFYGDSPSGVAISIHPADFEQITLAISERYGKPQRDEVEEVTTRGGARYSNITRVWRKADSTLTVEKYGSRVDSGSVSYRLESSAGEFNLRKGERAKKGAGNL